MHSNLTVRRRLLAVLLSLMLLTLCSCGKKESASVSKDPASASAPVSDWEKFVNDYEKWADSYIELAEKVSKILPTLLCFLNIPIWLPKP